MDAYRAGAARVHQLMFWCEDAHIPFVTVWALPQDNFDRAPKAVEGITDAVLNGLRAMAAEERWRIRAIGALEKLPAGQVRALRNIEEATGHLTGTTLNVAVAYSGRDDIITAVRALARQQPPSCENATEQHLAAHLSTVGQPDVDLLIRTSGERRLSDFMTWQTAQAELYFTDTLWPDFNHHAFHQALQWYAHRDRRFGRCPPKGSSVPSNIDFAFSFPHRCSPDLDSARAHNLAWLRSHHLLDGAAAEHRYQAVALPEVSTYAYREPVMPTSMSSPTPSAIPRDLLDQLDAHDQQALSQAQSFVHSCLALVEQTPLGLRKPHAPTPLLSALADLLERLAQGMSPLWQRRLAQGLGNGFAQAWT